MSSTAAASADQPTDISPVSDRSRWITLYVLCVGMLMIILDQTIVNVALPSIQSDLGFSQSGLAWVVNAYLIPFGGLLLLAGRIGDLLGQKRVFMTGLIAFVGASALCGVAQSSEMLVGARFLQGAGGAMTSAVVLGMIVTMFPEPGEQAKAIGVYSFVAAAGASLGLLLGGVLTEAISWNWIFFVNVPIGIATAVLAYRRLSHEEGLGLGNGADVLGAALITSSLMIGVYTLVEAADYGWLSAHTLGFGAAGLALGAAFIWRESTAENPLMPLRLFRSRNVAGANLIQALMVAGMFGMFFIGALYMQQALGYDALEVGLAFLPVALAIGILSLGFSARLVTRFGARATLIPGLSLIGAGLLLFSRTPVDAGYLVDVFPPMILLGVGAGLSFPSLMTLSMSGATKSDSGLASGLVNTTLQVGGAIGLAVLATLSTTRTEDLEAAGRTHAEGLTSGLHLALYVGAGLLAVAIVAAITVLQHESEAEAAVQELEPGRSPEPAFSEAA